MVDAAQNCSFGRTESAWIAEEARTPISAHGQGLDFEGELADVHIFVDFAGGFGVASRVFEISQPLFHQAHDAIADGARAIVEFERGGGEKAAAGEGFLFAIGEPIFAEGAEERQAAKLRGGTNDFFDEDVAGFVHYGALQIFLRAKVGEEAALADAQSGGELANGETFEAFEGSEVDCFAEDGAAGFEAAGAARAKIFCGGGGMARAARDGGASWARVHFDAQIIARPFVLSQIICWAQNAAPGDGGTQADRGILCRSGAPSWGAFAMRRTDPETECSRNAW